MRILLLGATGRLGSALRATLVSHQVDAPTRAQLDLDQPERIADAIASIAPEWVINCAAWTDVDGAERDPAAALRINGETPGAIGLGARQCGASVLHISTNYVFDGIVQGALGENAIPRPVNEYGRSKLLGERRLASSGARYWILRVGWLYDGRPGGLVDTILRVAREQRVVRVARQAVAPSAATEVAQTMGSLLERLKSPVPSGVLHLAPPDSTTRRDWLAAICSQAGLQPTFEEHALEGTATRPPHCLLDSGRLRREFGLSMRPWHDALVDLMTPRSA